MDQNTREHIRDRRKMSWDCWFYAVQRMDLLIITISGAGLYVILETLKFSFENSISCIWVIKSAGAAFVLSIVINFISQQTGKKSNFHDAVWCDEQLCADENPTDEQIKLSQKHDTSAEMYSIATKWLNMTSMVLLFIGLGVLVLYFLIIF